MSEVEPAVAEIVGFSEKQLDVLHDGGPKTEVGYRIAWARTYLKYFGLLTNSSRGIWVLTEVGERFLEDPSLSEEGRAERLLELKAEKIRRDTLARSARESGHSAQTEPAVRDSAAEDGSGADADTDADEQLTWKQRLIEKLTSDSFSPKQFERLAQRLLRESGFTSVRVIGGPNDQGIDGTGVYRHGLLTFPVYFQCKRYRKSVAPKDVRDFRGAMQGRGDQGLLITTGVFTQKAREEAVRAGARQVDLIDDDRLCDLLKECELGVTTKIVEQVSVNLEFFDEI